MPARWMDGMLMLVVSAALIFPLPVLGHAPAESSTQDSLGSKAESKLGLDEDDAERLRNALGYAHAETTHGVGYGHHLHPFYYNNKEDSLLYQCALQGEWRPIVEHKPESAIDAALAPPPPVIHHHIPAFSHPAPSVIRHNVPAPPQLPTQTVHHNVHAAHQPTPLFIRHSVPAALHLKSRRRPFLRPPPPLFFRPLPTVRRPGPEFPPLGDDHSNVVSPPKLLLGSYGNGAYKDSYGDLIVNKFKNVVPLPVPLPALSFKLPPAPVYDGNQQFKDSVYKEAFAVLNLKDPGPSQNFADSNLNGVFADGTVSNDVSGEGGAGKENEPIVTSQDVQGPLSCTASSHYQVQEHTEEDNALHATEDTTFLSPPPAEPRGRSRFLWGQVFTVPRQRRRLFPFH